MKKSSFMRGMNRKRKKGVSKQNAYDSMNGLSRIQKRKRKK
jgi:hypothetical protein